MKVAIIGRAQILYETALRLHEEKHQIGCIITARAAPEYSRTERDFERLASELNASYLSTDTLDRPEVEKWCEGLDIGVSINWVSMVRQRHIDLFRLGILNAHQGNLPEYRGNACSNWAILNDEARITNTIHFMEGGKLDCGRIICQEHLELTNDTTITDVYAWSEKSAPELFVKALRILDNDHDFMLRVADVDSPTSFRCYPRLPQDGYIDWGLPASKIHNLVRAVCHPFAGAYTYHWRQGGVRKLVVLRSRVVGSKTKDMAIPGHVLENNRETGESLVQCGDGIIALLKCRYDDEQDEFAPGRRWKSIRMRLGVRPDDWLWEIYGKKKPGR